MPVEDPIGRVCTPLEIWLEHRAHLGPGPVQQHPGIRLLKPESVTHLLRRAALDVTQNQHQPLVLGQRCDGALEVLTCLLGQEPALRRGSQVGRRVRPAARLGRMVDGLEMVRGDHGLGRLDRGVEARDRHHPSLAGGSANAPSSPWRSASITLPSLGATTCAVPESLAASIIPAPSTLRVSRSCPCGALSLTRGPEYRHKSA